MLRLLTVCQTDEPRGIFLWKKSCVFPRTKVSTSRPAEIKRPSKRRRTSDPFRPLGGCCCCGYRCSSSSSCRTSDAGMIYVPCRDPSSHMFVLAAPNQRLKPQFVCARLCGRWGVKRSAKWKWPDGLFNCCIYSWLCETGSLSVGVIVCQSIPLSVCLDIWVVFRGIDPIQQGSPRSSIYHLSSSSSLTEWFFFLFLQLSFIYFIVVKAQAVFSIITHSSCSLRFLCAPQSHNKHRHPLALPPRPLWTTSPPSHQPSTWQEVKPLNCREQSFLCAIAFIMYN